MDVIWHELECASYAADLPLWHELAEAAAGPVLDVGAGTGRVALPLAYAGHELEAVELDPGLARELARRGRGLPLHVTCADAQALPPLRRRFALVLVPMQTIHLMARPQDFLAAVRDQMRSSALLAISLLGEGVAPFREELDPDETWVDGVRYASTPTALWLEGETVCLERRREAAGELIELNVMRLRGMHDLAGMARDAGFVPEPSRVVPPTRDHAGSEVVMLRA